MVGRVTPVRAVLCDCIATARRGLRALPFCFSLPRGKAPQWGFVFTLMTLEFLGETVDITDEV